MLAESKALLLRVLADAGDSSRQRLFRMSATLCLHRAITAEELDQLPDWFHEAEAIDPAGGPVEILEETETGLPSTRPCERPTQIPLDPRSPLIWLPGDCGACGPCRARATLREQYDQKAARLKALAGL